MTKPSTKTVEVLLTTYNGAAFVKEQLASLFAQTVQDFTLLIWDDGSMDETVEIIEVFRKKHPQRITLFKGPTSGSAKKNFIRLMEKATADYVFLCDQDDIWLETKMENALEIITHLESEKGEGTPLLVHTDLQVVEQNLTMIDSSFAHYVGLWPVVSFKEALMQNDVTGCTAVYNKALSTLFQTNLPDAEKIVMHDWWLALIAHEFGQKEYSSEALILYRQHGQNSMGAKKSYGVKYKIKKLLSGQEVKRALKETYIQAGEFKRAFSGELSENTEEMLLRFSEMENMGKWRKIRQMHRYGFFRKRTKQKIAQIVFA